MMANEVDLTKFRARLAERHALQAAREASQQAISESFDDCVPEVEAPREWSKVHESTLRSIDELRDKPILQVYDEIVRGRREQKTAGQVRMQCPMPGHSDEHFSASMSIEKNVWTCHGPCDVGGSVFDLVGAAWGYSIPLRGIDVWEVKKRIAGHYGVEVPAGHARTEATTNIQSWAAELSAVGTAQLDDRFSNAVAEEKFRIRVRETARSELRNREDREILDRLDLTYTLADLKNERDDPHQYSIDCLALYGTNTLILGDSKSGKTSLVFDLIRAFVDREPLLGRFQARAIDGNVGYLNFEVDRRSTKKRMVELQVQNPIKVRPVPLRGYRFDLADRAVFERLALALRESEIEVLIVDPWRRVFAGDDENSATQVGRYTELLDELKEASGTVVDLFMPAHSQKNPQRFQESARGSSTLENWYDNLWVLRKDQLQDGSFERSFRLGVGRDADHDELMGYHRVVRDPSGHLSLDLASRPALTTDETSVLAYVISAPGCSKRAAIQGCRIEHTRGMSLIANLITRGLLNVTKGGPRGAHQLWVS